MTSELLEVELTTKMIERLTERIGSERVAERDTAIVAWKGLRLKDRRATPPGIKGADLAVISCDGGRMQQCEKAANATSHWREYKASALMEFESEVRTADPAPELPAIFLDRDGVHALAREIGHWPGGPDESYASPADTVAAESSPNASRRDRPKLVWREVCASLCSSDVFGEQMACRAWQLGFTAARRKAFLGDGQSWIWTTWLTWFKHLGFVPIIDFVHTMTYVFAGAMAGRRFDQAWPTYERWIIAVWQGRVEQVITELAARQQELGLPSKTDGETSPRRLVSEALTYLQNQQGRMNYPEYRRLGLPIMTAYMESTIKCLNSRVKGTEKFWSSRGGEALLQLRADQLSDSDPLSDYWRRRVSRMSGTRTYSHRAA